MIYVQAVDNKFYGNPTIYNDGGVLNFEDGIPEITIRSYARTTPVSGILRARQVLKDMGIKTKAMKFRGVDRKPLPPKWKANNCMIFNFRLPGPIPLPMDFEAVTADPPLGCTMICFCISMPKDRLLKAIDESKDMDRTLMNLLLNVPFHIIPTMRVKNELRKLITSQYPDLANEKEDILRVNKVEMEDEVSVD